MIKSYVFWYQLIFQFILILFAIMYSWLWFVIIISYIIVLIWWLLSILHIKNDTKGYGISFGALGSGKTTTGVVRMSLSKTAFSNIPLKHTYNFDLIDYLKAVGPNKHINVLQGQFIQSPKNEIYEGQGVVYDDLALYMPNYMDNELKKLYPNIGLMFPVRRHLYNHPYFLMIIQDPDRLYKVARELQTEYYLKAVGVWRRLWRLIPIFGMGCVLNYIFYDNVNSAKEGKLPYKEVALLDKAVAPIHVGAGRALEKIYNAENGKIIRRRIYFFVNSKTRFDTRYFHDKFFDKSLAND